MSHDTAIILVGPTATGKTELALKIAERYSGQIISVDSMQVYKFMDIGTAKPTQEERARVPHHLIDVVFPDEDYNVARFTVDAIQSMALIRKQGSIPVLAGGTGLYLKGVLEGLFHITAVSSEIRANIRKQLEEEGRASLYEDLKKCDPDSAARIHPNDTHRLIRALEIYKSSGMTWFELLSLQKKGASRTKPLKLGLTCGRNRLYERINARVGIMVELGLLMEVRNLLEMGYHAGLKSMQSIGYRHMVNYLKGVWNWENSLELLARDTRRYAKRQLTWFRRDSEINWFDIAEIPQIFSRIDDYLGLAQK